WLMMSLWDALRMNMMISYQELVRTFPNANGRTTTQDLKFQATLKRDGNATVKPGGFKATSTFQVTYE
ncbi:hypothetical protein R9P73_07390, partial [Escherichia coli]